MKPTLRNIKHYLLGHDDEALFAEAEAIKRKIFGQDVYLRGIVEFSNTCCRQCRYCGLRAPNTQVTRYRLSHQEIVEAACRVSELGIGTVVLKSGNDFSYSAEAICAMVREIKQQCDVAVTLSVGDRPHDDLAMFRESGADRYVLKVETTDPDVYASLRPGEKLKDRLIKLDHLRKLGLEVGSGIIVGLPGIDLDALARDVMRLIEWNLDMIAIGPFVPHLQTPLHAVEPGSLDFTLRIVALCRIFNPAANIPATNALCCITKDDPKIDGRELGLRSGCNVIMPTLTPARVRRSYEIYPGRNAFSADTRHALNQVKEMIKRTGYFPSHKKGFGPGRTYAAGTTRRAVGHRNRWAQECGEILAD